MSALRWTMRISMRNEPDLSVWRAYDGERLDPVGYVEGPTAGGMYAARAWPTGKLLGLAVTLEAAQDVVMLAVGT